MYPSCTASDSAVDKAEGSFRSARALVEGRLVSPPGCELGPGGGLVYGSDGAA